MVVLTFNVIIVIKIVVTSIGGFTNKIYFSE